MGSTMEFLKRQDVNGKFPVKIDEVDQKSWKRVENISPRAAMINPALCRAVNRVISPATG